MQFFHGGPYRGPYFYCLISKKTEWQSHPVFSISTRSIDPGLPSCFSYRHSYHSSSQLVPPPSQLVPNSFPCLPSSFPCLPSSFPTRSHALRGNVFATLCVQNPAQSILKMRNLQQPLPTRIIARTRISPMLWDVHIPAFHRIIVYVFNFLKHHFFVYNRLWMAAFLP